MAALESRRAMGKLTVLFILVAFLVVILVVAVKDGISCPPNAYCPSGGPPVSTDGGHYTPPDPDVLHEDFRVVPAL
jgi:hypothetical protein